MEKRNLSKLPFPFAQDLQFNLFSHESCLVSWSQYTPPKAQLRLLWLGSFLLRENYHPIEFRFQAVLIMPKRLNTIGLFRKPPRAWMHYDMSQVQCKTFPFPCKTGFWINGHPPILASEKKTGLENPNRSCHCVRPSGMRG